MGRRKTKEDIISQIKYGIRNPLKGLLKAIKKGAYEEDYKNSKSTYYAALGTTLDISLVVDIILLILPEYSLGSAIIKILCSYIFSLIALTLIVIVGQEMYLMYRFINKHKRK